MNPQFAPAFFFVSDAVFEVPGRLEEGRLLSGRDHANERKCFPVWCP
jgi:hypothetical protein